MNDEKEFFLKNFLPVTWCGRTGPGFLLFGIGISSPNWVPMRGWHHFILFFFRLWFFGRVFMIIIVTDLFWKKTKKTHQYSCFLATPFSLEDAVQAITTCVKVPFTVCKTGLNCTICFFVNPGPCASDLLQCVNWLLHPLEVVKA